LIYYHIILGKEHFNITVKGKVQGVWYRKFVCDHALSFGLTGIVKNLHNGNVYAEVEGDKIDIEKLLDLLEEGPPLARVSEVIFEKGDYVGFEGFKISR
jgi:acylphosphatase